MSPHRLIAHHKANSLRLTLRAQYNLKECLWHNNLIAPYGFMCPFQQHRSAHNINITILLSPCSAVLFQRVPHSRVQSCQLRTHIRHQETLLHSPFRPFVVTCRTHVPTIISRTIIIRFTSLRGSHTLIIREINVLSFNRSVHMISS